MGRNRAAKLRRSGEADRAGAQALHGEGEVREPVMKRQRLAGEAGLARIDGRCVAIRRRDTGVEQTRLSERRGEAAAGGVDVVMVDFRRAAPEAANVSSSAA